MAVLRFLVLAAAALLPLGAAQAAAPAAVQSGVDRWRAGDWAGAVAQWQAPAAAGDADAMFNLGQAYKLGRGVPADPALAREWYRRAAAKGHLPAQTNLGILLFQAGEKPEAMRWLKTAADRGEARAQYVFGIATYNGDGTPRSPGLAYGYLLRASARGLAQATQALSSIEGGLSPADRSTGEAVNARLAAGQLPNAVPGVAVAAPPPTVARPPAPPATVAAAPRPAPPAASTVAPAAVTVTTTTTTTAAPTRTPAVAAPTTTAARPAPVAAATTPPANLPPASVQPPSRPTPPASAAGPAVRTIDLPPAAGPSTVTTPPRPAPVKAPITAVTSPPAAVAPKPADSVRPAIAAPPKPTTWRVQLGAFGRKAAAEEAWAAITAGHKDLVKGVTVIYQPAGLVTKLQLGPLKSRDAARDLCARMAFAGRACFVTQE